MDAAWSDGTPRGPSCGVFHRRCAGANHHGRGGPLPIHRAPPEAWGPVDAGLRDAALACGHPWNPDLNAPEGEGVSCYPINSRDLKRVTTNDGYLEPARGRPNLTIQGEALIDRVLLEEGRAVGVVGRLGGETRTWRGREIALCAGAVHSPAILMRSGLGPSLHLQALGIPVARELPEVGRNFMDHPMIRVATTLKAEHATSDPDQRHTNCCVTYSSGLGGGGARDMILIAFNHRNIDAGGAPDRQGGVGVALYDAFSRGEVTPDVERSTHSSVAFSTVSTLRHGLLRRTTSLLKGPYTSAR